MNKLSRPLQTVLAWLVLSIIVVVYTYHRAGAELHSQIEPRLQEHLMLTLDESYFSRAEGQGNDQHALHRIGTKMNEALHDYVVPRWYSPYRQCSVQIEKIADADIVAHGSPETLSIFLPRNQIEREVLFGVECAKRPWVGVLLSSLLGLAFWIIVRSLPPPLSKAHRSLINYLLASGYTGEQAFAQLRDFSSVSLELDEAQKDLMEFLHRPEDQNFSSVLRLVTDARVTNLTPDQHQWLQLGLQHDLQDLEAALALALADDSLAIDLRQMRVLIRTMPIDIGTTPLLYYAWYAKARIEGDGWLTNPASNRPNREAGEELAAFMEAYGGHGRAINDLQSSGLKAKTLDQNRSKIKEEITKALGDTLATKYLFEADRMDDGVQMRYRLRLAAEKIALNQ